MRFRHGHWDGLRHDHWDAFEVVGWVGDKRRGLGLLREPTWSTRRFLRDVVIRNINIFKIRLAPAWGRVMRWAEGELGGGRERRCNRGGWGGKRRGNDRSRRRVPWGRLLDYRRVVDGLTRRTKDRTRGTEDRTRRAHDS